MNANNLRFWLLANANHWRSKQHVTYDSDCQVLHLASERTLPEPTDPTTALSIATSALERIPRTSDPQGAVAHWNATASAIVARSTLPDEAVMLPLEATPTDLIVGFDSILYCALPDSIRMHDLRSRWDDITVAAADFVPWRLAADPAGGVWVLERSTGRLARLTGQPLPLGPFFDYAGTVFRPAPENCHEPVLRPLPDLDWPPGEHVQALAGATDSSLAFLTWVGDGEAQLRPFDTRTEHLRPPIVLSGARYAYAFDWLAAGKIAVRLPGRSDAPAFDLGTTRSDGVVMPSGEFHPLATNAIEAPFVHRLQGPALYPVELADGVRGAEPLHPLSISNLARHGEARSFGSASDLHLIDSGSLQTIWHRLYAEAQLPPRTGFVVWLAATPDATPPDANDPEPWQPHYFGDPLERREPHAPQAAWERAPSELPNHPGLGPWVHEPSRAGLLSVLIQNARQQVRTLIGRYLWVRVTLSGDGRVTPLVAALRAYGSRFSYRDQYLPRLYRESVFGIPASRPGTLLGKIATTFDGALDAGGPLDDTLLDELTAAGAAAGQATTVETEATSSKWLLRDPQSGRAWRLQKDDNAISVFTPRATPADFLERFLDNFEGELTTLEDRIAAAHLLTDPNGVPHEHLDWLAGWIGVAFDPALPATRRRAWLAAAPYLARLHGTRLGLQLALDIASGGGVRGGEIIVLENFRLRRILATLLGVDLAGDEDPLLPSLVVSGNSVVGDTLTLGEQARVELLARFRTEITTAQENADVIAFLDQLANRATVLVHQTVTPQDLGLLRRIVELESPAHVLTDVQTATWPFLVGIASLIGVDTYLGPSQVPQPARVDISSLGQDFVIGPVSLDPRMAGAAAPAPSPPERPVADAGDDFIATSGNSFNLDASRSRAAPGRSLASYIWRRLPQL